MTQELLSNFLLSIKYNTLVETYDESATKQTIILPILNHLGWNTNSIDEVQPEYPVNGKKIDYLITSGITDVFMEVKKTSEKLEKHEEQILTYSFKKGVELSVLTNGLDWWFYLPMQRSSWKDRKFLTLDVKNQEVTISAQTLSNVLSKQSIKDKSALNYANGLLSENLRKRNVNIALPKVWQNLMNDFDSPLAKMIIDQMAEKYGVQPTMQEVRELIYKSLTQKTNADDIQNYRYFDARPSVAHVLEVCWLHYKTGMDYKRAVNTVARKRDLVSTTVMDQCTRRLGIKAEDFRIYLADKKTLIAFLNKRFTEFTNQIENYLLT